MMTKERCQDAKLAYAALMKCYPLTLSDLPGEIWLPVPEWEERYHVSTFGRVKSFKGKTKILKPSCLPTGYLFVGLHKGGKQTKLLIHRLVALTFIPNPDSKPEVNHIDGHPLNCHVSNLEWCTRSENLSHAISTGLIRQGEDHHSAKFTNEQIVYMRDNPDSLSTSQLGRLFDVQPTVISAIQLGKTYRNAGGTVRDKIERRIPNEVREAIRAEYQKGVKGRGSYVLAKKYGISQATIWNIVHEG